MSTAAATPAVSVQLPGGPLVILAILRPSEVLMAMKSAGKGDPEKIKDLLHLNHELLRVSVRQVDGKAVAYDDLSGEGWREHFPRTRHIMQLVKVWGSQHVPDEAARSKLASSVKVTVKAGAELWTVQLPDGPEITMREMDPASMGDALDDAQKAATSPLSGIFLSSMKHGAKCITSIDGNGTTEEDLTRAKWDEHFTTFHTYLIGHLWTLIHEGGDELDVGEVKPVSGIG